MKHGFEFIFCIFKAKYTKILEEPARSPSQTQLHCQAGQGGPSLPDGCFRSTVALQIRHTARGGGAHSSPRIQQHCSYRLCTTYLVVVVHPPTTVPRSVATLQLWRGVHCRIPHQAPPNRFRHQRKFLIMPSCPLFTVNCS